MTPVTIPTEPGDYRNVDGVVVRIDENGSPFRVLDIVGATHVVAILDLAHVVDELGPFEPIIPATDDGETPPPAKPAAKAAPKPSKEAA